MSEPDNTIFGHVKIESTLLTWDNKAYITFVYIFCL